MNPFKASSVYPALSYDGDPREYHKIGESTKRGEDGFVMSRSQLMDFDENPWEWLKGKKDDATSEMEWGSLLDCMVTTPSMTRHLYAVYPETYPAVVKGKTENKPWNLNADFCKEWRDKNEAEGLTCIKPALYEEARIACARLMEDERIARLVSVSRKQVQVVVEYHDKDTGIVVPFRMMLDFQPAPDDAEFGQFLADMKEVNDIRPYEYEKKIFSQGWHVQAALYLDGTNAAMGEEHYSGFYHIIQKSEWPYPVGRRMLSEEFLALGRSKYLSALQRYCRCLKENKWPGIDDEDNVPGSPVVDGWRLAQPASYMV